MLSDNPVMTMCSERNIKSGRFLFGEADDEGAAFGEIGVRDFGDEGQVEVVGEAGGVGSVIEEINDVPAEAVAEAAALVEIEGAGGVDLNVARFFQERGEDALEEKRSATDLLHGEGDGVVGHGDEYKTDGVSRGARLAVVTGGNCLQWVDLLEAAAHIKDALGELGRGLSYER